MSDRQFEAEVKHETNAIKSLLIEKNRAYGNSALKPKRIFATGMTASGMIRVRIDDKLSRITNQATDDEDSVQDLLGYLVLLRIAERRERAEVLSTQAALDRAARGFGRTEAEKYGPDQDGTFPAKALIPRVKAVGIDPERQSIGGHDFEPDVPTHMGD